MITLKSTQEEWNYAVSLSMNEEKKVSRRRFLKYAGGAVVVVAAAAAGAGYYETTRPSVTSSSTAITPSTTASTSAMATGPIKIGGIAPITGYFASDGQDMVNGWTMALEDINYTIGGRPVQLITDDVGDLAADVTAAAYEKQCTVDNVDIILTGYSAVYGNGYEICRRNGVPLIHADTNYQFTKYMQTVGPDAAWMLFMCDPDNQTYGPIYAGLVDSIIAQGVWKPVNNTDYGLMSSYDYDIVVTRSFIAQMLQRGWTNVGLDGVSDFNVEWGPSLTKILENPPDIIFQSHAVPASEASFIQQFVANPTKSLVFQHYSPAIPEYLSLAKSAANGVLWMVDLGIAPGSQGDAWKAAYQSRFKTVPGITQGPNCYDMINLYKSVVESIGTTDKRTVATGILNSQYQGLCGKYVFRPDIHECIAGDDFLPSWGFQIRDQQHVLISPAKWAVSQFELPPWF
jgi:branched-chain amino acid transport system substrate-binding protein